MKKTIDLPPNVDLVTYAASRILAPDYTPDSLAVAEEEKRRLVRFKRDLLPLENAEPVENRLGQALEKAGRLRSQQMVMKVNEGRYQILDPSVFSFRDAAGMPRLMPFRLSQPEAGFIYESSDATDLGDSHVRMVRRSLQCGMFPEFPIHIREHYLDVIGRVKAKGDVLDGQARTRRMFFPRLQSVQLKLQTRFGGYIPEEVKWEMVRAWKSGMFQNLFIVSEVRDWQENTVVVSLEGDPLVVGYDGYQLWLIAAFDTTNLEQVVQDEFCTKVGN